jgi:hypothetical protein
MSGVIIRKMINLRTKYIFFHQRNTGSLKINYSNEGYWIVCKFSLSREQYFDSKQGFTTALVKLRGKSYNCCKKEPMAYVRQKQGNHISSLRDFI